MTLSGVVGRYVPLEVDGLRTELYFESAGEGIPLLCLHTAGADGRQFHGLMGHPGLAGFQVVAPDLPAHGRSYPLDGWWRRRYVLTWQGYRRVVLALVDALPVEQPVLLGCSAAGAIVSDLALTAGDRLRAAIGLGTPLRAEGRRHPYLRDRRCDTSEVAAFYTFGLHGPTAGDRPRHENAWIYAQSAPGVYDGDLVFYSEEWDAADVEADEHRRCRLYLFTGEYDYSCLPASTEEAAAVLGARRVEIMKGLGHFPMVEDPDALVAALAPTLHEIMQRERQSELSSGM